MWSSSSHLSQHPLELRTEKRKPVCVELEKSYITRPLQSASYQDTLAATRIISDQTVCKSVALWVMWALGFNREEEHVE